MPNREIKNTINHINAFDIQEITTNTTTVGDIVDTEGFDSFLLAFLSGTITDGTYTILIEDGDDPALSDAAPVDDTFLTNTEADTSFTASEDNTSKTIGYVGNKQFVRPSIVSAGTSSGGFFGAIALLGNPGIAATGANS